MARPPTILADPQLPAAMQSPSAQAVSSGLGDVAVGLSQLSRSVEGSMVVQGNLDKQRQARENAKWVGDSLYQEMNSLNKWQSENNADPDYAEKFLNYANERIQLYSKSAPNKNAQRDIESRLKQFVAARYDQALGVTERTRMDRSRESVISQTSFTLGTIRDAKNLPGVDVMREAETSRLDIRDNIQKLFPGQPEVARRMSAYVDAEIALGVAPLDKSEAERIINESTDIEQADKPTLLYKVGVLAKAQDQANVDQTSQIRRDHLAMVEAGNSREKLPLSLYSVYEDPRSEKAKDDKKIDILNDTHDHVTKIAPLNRSAMNRELNKLQKSVTTEHKSLVLENLARQMVSIDRMRENDRVGWMRQYNPEVRALEQQLVGADPTSPQYKSLTEQVNSAILKYQGYPPDPKAADADLYLSLATNDRSLMSKEESAEHAASVNQGDANAVVQKIDEVLSQFPNIDQQMVAFNDMVELTGNDAIKPEYQLLWQNKGMWFVQHYAKALSDSKSLAKLTDETRTNIDNAVDSNSVWKQFESSLISAGRLSEAQAFKSGVMIYANYLQNLNQNKITDAANDAVNQLISSTLGFAEVNGRSLMVYRPGLEKEKRTDADIRDLGRRLTVSLSQLDPREVNQERFGGLQNLHPDEFNIDRLQALRDVITRTGFFVNENDGQSVTLFVVGDDGLPFQLRDRNNRAFQIFFSDVPDYTYFSGVPGGAPFMGVDGLEQSSKILPQSTYPLRMGYNESVSWFDKMLMWPEKQTHWPMTIFKRKDP